MLMQFSKLVGFSRNFSKGGGEGAREQVQSNMYEAISVLFSAVGLPWKKIIDVGCYICIQIMYIHTHEAYKVWKGGDSPSLHPPPLYVEIIINYSLRGGGMDEDKPLSYVSLWNTHSTWCSHLRHWVSGWLGWWWWWWGGGGGGHIYVDHSLWNTHSCDAQLRPEQTCRFVNTHITHTCMYSPSIIPTENRKTTLHLRLAQRRKGTRRERERGRERLARLPTFQNYNAWLCILTSLLMVFLG